MGRDYIEATARGMSESGSWMHSISTVGRGLWYDDAMVALCVGLLEYGILDDYLYIIFSRSCGTHQMLMNYTELSYLNIRPYRGIRT